jgi:acetyltransferase-like isoleucine patch superfamily enzyme
MTGAKAKTYAPRAHATAMAPRRLTPLANKGRRNALLHIFHHVSRWRVAWNMFWIMLAKKAPFFAWRRGFLRMTGAKVGRHVAIALDAQPDVLFPQLITIGDNSIIGYNTTILCHDVTVERAFTGPVRIGANVTIGANCTILAGVSIADGSIISAHSLVNTDVEGFAGGVPAKPLRTKDEPDNVMPSPPDGGGR